MSLEQITSRRGLLSKSVLLFDRSTIQHSDEIQKNRFDEIRANKSSAVLPKQWFWTADFPMYVMDDKEVVLYIGRGKDNLAFDNIVYATNQLIDIGNYFINDRKNIDAVINVDTTLKVVLSDLRLKGTDLEWRYIEIDTKKCDKLNTLERALAERVHGKGRAFYKTMKMLSDAGKTTTRIYTLNPEYVKKTVPENGAIARVSALDLFGNNSYFGAVSRSVGRSSGRLRGVLLTSEAGASKIVTPKFYDISHVIAEGARTSSFAPDQVEILRSIMAQNNYRIIKCDAQ
jgi:hypothetical protein